MGRMKEIFMEVYEQYDGEIPVDFDFDTYISDKISDDIDKSIYDYESNNYNNFDKKIKQ